MIYSKRARYRSFSYPLECDVKRGKPKDQGDRFMIARAERLTRPVPLIPMCDSLLMGWRFVTNWVTIRY